MMASRAPCSHGSRGGWIGGKLCVTVGRFAEGGKLGGEEHEFGFFLVAMIWSALPLLWSVNVEKGREDAHSYSERGGRQRT